MEPGRDEKSRESFYRRLVTRAEAVPGPAEHELILTDACHDGVAPEHHEAAEGWPHDGFPSGHHWRFPFSAHVREVW